MKHLLNKIEIAYLPDLKDEQEILDIADLRILNEAYQWSMDHKVRSFCTYLGLIPYIQAKNYITRLVPVIDFPNGDSNTENKIFMAGISYDACKKSSASEIDVVLNSDLELAIKDLAQFTKSKTNKFIPIKYIIELGIRSKDDIKSLLIYLSGYNCKFIKTNTGKKNSMCFAEKLELVRWLRDETDLPIKVSGGVNSFKEMEEYIKVAGDNTIFGVSYEKIKNWELE